MKSFFQSHFFLPFPFLVSIALSENSPAEIPPVSLHQLLAEVGANHPEAQFYEAEIAAAKAGRRTAARLSDPELTIDLGRKRVRDAVDALAGEGTAWAVSIRQTFEWPGRIDLRKAIANRQVELAELGLARFNSALTARARTLAYGVYAASAKAAALREVADRFATLKETFVAREPAGITPLLETRVIEASELALQRRASEAQLALQASLIELNQLRGTPPDASFRVATPELKLNEAPVREVLIAAACENNFEFRMRRVELEQQGFAVRLSRNERYPSVTAGPSISHETAGDRETVIGLSLSLPLPVSGRSRSAVDLTEARRKQAEVAVLLAQRNLEKEVLIVAYAFATKLAETRRWSPDAVTRFREAAELADRHYRLGAVPIATYVELQNSYVAAVEALLDTQREALEAGLKLQELTGLDFHAAEDSK